MKIFKTLLLIFLPLIFYAQNSDYSITSYLDEGTKAPNTHYIGEAWLNRLLSADEDLKYNITKATFKAYSTLDWHKHSSSKESDVTYLALYGGTQPTTWTEVLSQEDYDSVAEKLKE